MLWAHILREWTDMMDLDGLVRLGTILKSHGVNGEMALSVPPGLDWSDDPDYLVCMMDGIPVPFYPDSIRGKSSTVVLVKFQDYDNVDDISRFMGVTVYMPREYLVEHDSDELLWERFLGWQVSDTAAGPLGVIKAVDESTPNVLFLVVDGSRERVIPANPVWITQVDKNERTLRYNLPEGLADL
ncbi:MAG: Ribosome maturation factor RimM [Bacteroidetes bacterium ADurb.BinA104]|nr:MAG: Ribosome maturation factor RimM [Bacteroidetes bacterium ADurb.BinA104]